MKTPVLRRLTALSLAALCVFAVAACSNSRKEDQAYKNSKALPPLEVPPDLVNPPKDASTAIPNLPPATEAPASTAFTQPPAVANPAPAPAPTAAVAQNPPAVQGAVPTSAAIHIEKQGALRWLVVPAPVTQVQQRVKDFLLQKGFSFAKEEPGTLETEWRGGDDKAASGNDLDAALQRGLQDKYKLRIETGRIAGTSEVTVSHFGLQRAVVDGKPQWLPRAADPMLEADLLDQLRAFLASEGTAVAPVSDLPAVKAQVTVDNQGAATLSLNENFDRAWRRVDIALGRGGFVVQDRNRSEGIYMIRLGTAFKEDANAGFVARLFGSNGGDPNEKYRIAVKDHGDETLVVVQFPSGGPVHTGIGERILERLKEKME
jgi:outer membrane protein assembly factor BamC